MIAAWMAASHRGRVSIMFQCEDMHHTIQQKLQRGENIGISLKAVIFFLSFMIASDAALKSQELYVFSEPASNMPSRALSARYAGKFLQSSMSGDWEHRQKLYASFGLDKRWMLRTGTTFSNMYSQPATRWESVNIYAKYRFFSRDEVHRHFRMAAFMEASYSQNDLMYDEVSLEGDQSGVQTGLVMTQLLHKLAISSTIGITELLHWRRWDETHTAMHPYQAFNYSFSAGYLLFPRHYSSYQQTNLNLYLELLGSRNLDRPGHYVDLAPAVQLILNSNTKINTGYRFQLAGNMFRMAQNSLLISVETTFLNVLKRKSS